MFFYRIVTKTVLSDHDIQRTQPFTKNDSGLFLSSVWIKSHFWKVLVKSSLQLVLISDHSIYSRQDIMDKIWAIFFSFWLIHGSKSTYIKIGFTFIFVCFRPAFLNRRVTTRCRVVKDFLRVAKKRCFRL